jgi:hypothetical protein
LLSNFALEYAITKVQANVEGKKLNEKHQFLLCANYANLLDNIINTVNEKDRRFIGFW